MADGTAYLLRELARTREELIRCRDQLRKANARRRPRAKPHRYPRSWNVEQWRQHELIVARIRAIPDRDIS